MRETAQLLGISHSGLSKSMRTLGEDLGVTLFVAEGRGIAITDDGMRVYRSAKGLLGEVDRFLEGVHGVEPRRSSLRIATFEVFSTYFLGEFVAEEIEEGTGLLVRELVPGPLEEAVASGDVDIGITYLPIPRPEIAFERVATIEMAIYGKPSFRKLPFEEWPFCAPAIPISGTPTRARGLDGWPDHELARDVRYHVDMMETALDLCRRGLGVVYLPTFVAALHNRIASRALRLEQLPRPRGLGAGKREVHLVRRKSSPESPWARKLARRLRLITRAS